MSGETSALAANCQPFATKVCRKCLRELPATDEYFQRYSAAASRGRFSLEGACKRCRQDRGNALRAQNTVAAKSSKALPGRFTPRLAGEGGPSGGFTEYQSEGYRFCCLPDTHGYYVDWQAVAAALAFIRYYRPQRIILLGDHVDFDAVSRFLNPPDKLLRIGDDIAACQKFLGLVRESAGPDCRIEYLCGNHEKRLDKYVWSHAPALAALKWTNLPSVLELSKWNIDWMAEGTVRLNSKLIAKHGNLVRKKSGYTATAEREQNGVSGISAHTHRAGVTFHRNLSGVYTWLESGCLCNLNPDYAEGQTMDWQHAMTHGTVSLSGNSFTANVAPIVKGRVMAAGMEIGP
jgi:hypothetical protein